MCIYIRLVGPNLPVGKPGRANWVRVAAMGSDVLEPDLSRLSNGDKVNLVFEVILHSSNRSLCRTKCLKQLFTIDHVFADVHTPMPVLQATMIPGKYGMQLNWDDDTKWIIHPPQHCKGLLRVVEACSGIGIMGKGFECTGATTSCYVDNNREYCRWLRDHGSVPVVEGDICDPCTIAAVSKHVQHSHVLTGGFSCQPFSKLGDERHEDDPRSASFWGMLHAGYQLQSLAIVLECTSEAATASCVQKGLAMFAQQTGYTVTQSVLHLHTVWPARRTRWWAVLAHPSLALDEIRQLPHLEFQPGIMHLMPTPLPIPADQVTQLQLSEEELRKFHADRKGFKGSVTDFCKPLPTATHSWGSQATGCHCGCRSNGFSDERIRDKGLYGQLIQLETEVALDSCQVNGARHLHPQEVALLNALIPSYVTPSADFHLRLELSAVGQMASPIQSLWVLAQVHSQAHKVGFFPAVPSPEEVLANLCKKLLDERDVMWSHRTEYMHRFALALNALHPKVECTVPNALPNQGECTAPKALHDKVECTDPEALQTRMECTAPEALHAKVECTGQPSQVTGDDLEGGLTQEILEFLNNNHGEVLDEPIASRDPYLHQVQGSLSDIDVQDLADLLTVVDSDHSDTDMVGPDNKHLDKSDLLSYKHEHSNDSATGTDLLTEECQVPTSPSQSLPMQSEGLSLLQESPPAAPTPCRKRKHDQVIAPVSQVQFDIGAVPGFSTSATIPSTAVEDTEPSSPGDTAEETHAAHAHSILSERIQMQPEGVFVILDGENIHTIKIDGVSTIGQLAVATDKLGQMPEPIKITTAVGTQLPLSSPVQPGSFLRFQEVADASHWRCRGPHGHSPCPVLVDKDRATLLWQQEGWVANDEMKFYMNMVQTAHPEVQCHVVDIHPELDYHVVFTDILMKAITYLKSDKLNALAMAVMYHHHWFPLFIRNADEITISMPPDEAGIVRRLLEQSLGDAESFKFDHEMMPHAFHADCGFQTVGWLISKIRDEDSREPLIDAQAGQWRAKFHQHLVETHAASDIVHSPLRLGGMNVHTQLQQLLEHHGVKDSRSHQCAEQLIDCLGKSCVANLLKSPKPWADLKARANMHSPPIRIVLADELKEAVQRRSQNPNPVGRKSNKRSSKQPAPVQIQADQIAVPTSVFKQADGTELSQLSMQQINQNSRGVIVTNITEAIPYFSIAQPISNEGLGLLILDHTDSRLPPQHKVIQVPAHCKATSEPMIVTAALLQLGRQEVVRNLPSQSLAVQELDNVVLRVMVYKDQYNGSWDTLMQQPAKTILQEECFDHVTAADVLDVWDRQFMSQKLTKCKPAECETFSANFRLASKVTQPILSQSGAKGIYIEPRSDDGRTPCTSYQVIWLPQKSFAEATVAQQTTVGECHLVRNQNRYGLRVPNATAEQVHAAHRPEQSFIPGASTLKFRMGPMPYGSTKQSVLNICQKLGWQCRPLGPQGQTPDRTGTYWIIQAAAVPPNWIYHLAHGDVLISQVNPPAEREIPKQVPVLASTKTLTSLARSTRSDHPKDDPWLHDDPWKGPKHQKELSVGQFAAMEAALEQKILAKIHDPASRSDDSTMDEGVESRVTTLENKLEQLSNNMQTFQAGQQQHNQTITHQVQQLDAKVEQQVQSFHHALDSKLTDQMSRIEALFKKRTLGE